MSGLKESTTKSSCPDQFEMRQITAELIEKVTGEAKLSPRLRMNYNFHPELSDPVQRMLNALEPGTYIRPHKHATREECFVILRGTALALTFYNDGIIMNTVLLNREKGVLGIEFEEDTYHMLISLETGTVVYEIKEGPFIPHSVEGMADWAPEEGSNDSGEFLKKVISESGF
jgi:cupin fold WbuC family metalloprotein